MASFLSAEPDNLLITVCKQAEDAGDLIVRAYEAAGRAARGTIRLPFAAVEWAAEFEPHQIKTWRVGAQPGGVTEVDLLERPREKP